MQLIGSVAPKSGSRISAAEREHSDTHDDQNDEEQADSSEATTHSPSIVHHRRSPAKAVIRILDLSSTRNSGALPIQLETLALAPGIAK
jgi:hypothetical protein